MAAVFSSTSPPRRPRRRNYRALIGILAVQAFANQMAASFWLVYLVSPPQSLDFDVAILVWVIGFGVAACTVLWIARGRPIQATTSMVSGLAIMVLGHLSFAFLPALWGMVSGSVCFGLYVPLFWLPLNSLVVRETNHANRAGRLAGVTETFGIAAVILGRVSDRVRVRTPFLLLGPLLSVPACLLAYLVRDLGAFAFAIGWLSMTSAVAPSFIYTILIDRTEKEIPTVTATRELILNTSRTLVLLGGLAVLALGGDVYALYLLVGGVILLETLAT